MKTIAKISAWTLALGVGLVLVAGAAVTLFLQTDAGRQWLVARIHDATTGNPDFTLEMGTLSGNVFADATLDHITLADRHGPWLRLQKLHLQWSPMALLTGTLRIDGLSADHLHVMRTPEASSEGEANTADQDIADQDVALTELPVSVVVQEVTVREIELSEAVTGSTQRFTLDGRFAAPKGSWLETALSVTPLDHGQSRAQVAATYDYQANSLALEGAVQDPADGILSHVLDLDESHPFSLSVNGAGPLTAWQGDLTLDWGAIAQVTAALGLEMDRETRLSLTAEMASPWAEAQPTVGVFAKPATVVFNGVWQSDQVLAVEAFAVENKALAFEAKGPIALTAGASNVALSLQFAESVDWAAVVPGLSLVAPELTAKITGDPSDLRIDAATTPFSAALEERLQVDDAMVSVNSRGALEHPEMALVLDTGMLTVPGVTAFSQSRFSADLVLQGTDASADHEAQLLFSTATTGVRVPSDDPDDPLNRLAAEMRIEAAGAFIPAGNHVQLSHFSAAAAPAALTGEGDIQLDAGDIRAEVTLAIADLAPIFGGAPVGGTADLSLEADVRAYGAEFMADVDGVVAPEFSDPLLQTIAGKQTQLEARISGELEPGTAFVEVFHVQNAFAELALSGQAVTQFSELDFDYQLDIADLSPLEGPIQQAIFGGLAVNGHLHGPVEALTTTGTLTGHNLAAAELAFDNLVADYRVDEIGGEAKGQLTVDTDLLQNHLQILSTFSQEAGAFRIADLTLSDGTNKAEAKATIPVDGSPLTAEAALKAVNVASWLRAFGVDGQFAGTASLEMFPNTTRQDGQLQIALSELSAAAAGEPPVNVEQLTLSASLHDLLSAPHIAGNLAAKSLSYEEEKIEVIDATVTGGLQALDFTLQSRGGTAVPFDLTSVGQVLVDGVQQRLRLKELEGTVLQQPLQLLQPAEVTLAGAQISLADLHLIFAEAVLKAKADLSNEAVTAKFDLSNFSPMPFQTMLALSAEFDGRFTMNGSVAATTAAQQAEVTVAGTQIHLPGFAENEAAELNATADLQGQSLRLDGSLAGVGPTPLQLSGRIPFRLSTAPFAVHINENEKLEAAVTWQGDIAKLMPLVPVGDHDLRGATDIDLKVSGTLAEPKMAGQITLQEGRYENLTHGTLLQALTATVAIEDRKVTIPTFTATDGDKGTLEASGFVNWTPDGPLPLELNVTGSGFHVVRRDDITAEIDTDLTLTGTSEAALLSGRVKSGLVEIFIPKGLPPDVVDLEVEEVVPGIVGETTGGETETPASSVTLDIDVEMPGRIFVRGRGLDSEWAGNLKIAGPANKPAVTGHLEVLRGFLGLLGKRFNLERGKISFLSGDDIDPELDIQAIGGDGAVQGDFRITGTASKPDIFIGSIPSLPQDEVIAEVFFGKSSAALTPLEALEVAGALAQLSGQTGGGPGLLDSARKLVGVDVLRFDADSKDGETSPSVSAGKYISEGIYLGVKQGSGSQSSAVEVEVELTDTITLSTEARGTGETDVGIQFRWDY